MRFILSIETGNEAMQTQSDIARALLALVKKLHAGDMLGARYPEIGDGGPIHDNNGNRAGSWHVEESK